jgi:general secretion pathway protein F
LTLAVIPAERPNSAFTRVLRRYELREPESSTPWRLRVFAFGGYWFPARAIPAVPGSLGRDDNLSWGVELRPLDGYAMPTFRYRAYGAQGNLAEGSIDATSQDAATDALWLQGLTAFQLRTADGSATSWWRRELFAGQGFRPADLASFTREFATLASAEIPLDDALRIATDQATSPKVRAVVSSLLADVMNGATLSDAMQKHGRIFPGDYLSLVRAGEVGGHMGQVFEELADLLERRMEVRAKIHSSLIYPTVLVVLALASLGIIVGGLVPSIAPIFVGSGKPMPSGIAFLIGLNAVWPEILMATVLVVAVAVVAGIMAFRRPELRLAFDRLQLKTPLVGTFVLQQETARFARTLGTLLKAGVPLIHAATSAGALIGNRHVAAGVRAAIDSVREGAALHRALQSSAPLPPIAVRMISIGEEAGKLDRMLIRLAVTFEKQAQRTIDRFMTMLTPLLTVVIAVLVGGLIITVMNAILSINDLASS